MELVRPYVLLAFLVSAQKKNHMLFVVSVPCVCIYMESTAALQE